jgi:integrase
MALTVKRHHRLVRAGKAGMYLDGTTGGGVRGLYLVVEHKRNANWGLRYQLHKKTHWMGLGSALSDGVTLDQAREAAKAARAKLRGKIDPLQARRAEQAAARVAALKELTFAEAAKSFIEQNEVKWKNPRHIEQWTTTLATYAYPIIGKLPVSAVDTPLVLKCVEPIWKNKNATASRLRGRIESVLDWATVREYRSGENPARWKGHLEHVLPNGGEVAKVEHHPALPYQGMPAFVAKLRTRQGAAAQALLFTILTAARTQEAVGARWSEVDLKEKVWTVPPERMKGGVAHKVPLSDQALALLRSLYRDGDGDGYLFIGSRPGQSINAKALHRLLARMQVAVTVHGFRSSFRTFAAEQTNFPREVGEQSLAHTISDKTERAYKRTTLFDKRRQLMTAWAKFCMTPPPVQRRARDNVIAIGER